MTIHYELVRVLKKWFSLKAHQHGDITQDGKIGNDSGKILTTGTNGKIQTSASITTNQISDFPQDIPSGNHTHTFNSITSKPETYPPSTHSHSFDSITGKPTSYTPASHTHGSITNDGKLTATADAVSKIVITEPTTNAIKVVSELPFSKLNITKANITGLGIPSSDTNTTYTAGNGLKLTGTTFSVDEASATDIIHDTDDNPLPNIIPDLAPGTSVQISQSTLNQAFDNHTHSSQWEQIPVEKGTLKVNQHLGLAEYIYKGTFNFTTAHTLLPFSQNNIIPNEFAPVQRIPQIIHDSTAGLTIGVLYYNGEIKVRSYSASGKTISMYFLYRYKSSSDVITDTVTVG